MVRMRREHRLHASVIGALAMIAVLTGAPAESPVADAAQRGDIEAVKTLLRNGADVNASQGDGMTALHWAALHNDATMASTLVYAGANLEATTRLGGYTALHLAGRNGMTVAGERLLEVGSNANAWTTTGVTVLHLAAAAGAPEAVAALLYHGADVDALDKHSGRTPLMFATANNRLAAMEALLLAGADVSVTTTAVDYAALSQQDSRDRRRRSRVMTAVREAEEEARAEAELQSVADESAAQLQSRESEPPGTGRQERAQRVSREEAPPQSVADSSAAELKSEEQDAVDTTAVEKHEEVAAVEPDEEDAKADSIAVAQADSMAAADSATADTPDSAASTTPPERSLSYSDLVGSQGGMSALHYAARDGRLEGLKLLLEHGADIDQRTKGDQSTPLLVATINGNYDLAMYLLEQGADPDLASEDGAAPLYATLNNRWAPKALYPQPTAFKQQTTSYLEMTEALLKAGADPNRRLTTHLWYTSFNFDLLGVNFSGATAFWRAAYATDVPAMTLLVAYGADPDIPTTKAPSRRRRSDDDDEEDPSGLPPVPTGGDAVFPIHAASGVGYGVARAGNAHRHVPDGWIPAVRYLIEELGADVDARDHDGYSAVHFAAARGHNELIEYLVEHGADVTFVSRRGRTTVDMANGPIQRVQPFPETIALLEGLGAENNHNCVSC